MDTSHSARPSLDLSNQRTLLGHPVGLFTLFFAEMWERFSYYGMRALLLFYMLKGFLAYPDKEAYAVYGAYTALVYMTPFFGGLLADRVLGARRAVVFGGLLMAAGHLAMTGESSGYFFTGLALLIVGNGFFKPNISTMVGSLYPHGSPRRDAGFTIFYMGVNLGAAMSPLLCGYIGEKYGFDKGFGLATIGMLIGLAVFVAPNVVSQVLIGLGAIAAAYGLFLHHPDHPAPTMVNVFVGCALLVAATLSCLALARGGLPAGVGEPPDRKRLKEPALGGLSNEWCVYLGTLLLVPIFVLLVSGFAPLRADDRGVVLIPESVVHGLKSNPSGAAQVAATVLEEVSRPAGLVLFTSGILALVFLLRETAKLAQVARERMYVVLILTFFSMLFWAFFEQAGSSINNFTDRNVDRVSESRRITEAEVGTTIRLQPTQEQLGYTQGAMMTLDRLDSLRAKPAGGAEGAATSNQEIDWQVTQEHVGMGVAEQNAEIPASTFQSANPIYILLLGLPFAAMWGWLHTRGLEPSTPLKFTLGLLQVGLGFAALWYGTTLADSRGMVGILWLLVGYLLHTTGELCLSPVGLSMISRLSPGFLVSTTMGMWFLATAFSQFLAAIIAQFTGVQGAETSKTIPPPIETVHVYGQVFLQIAIAACISSAICLALVPKLKRWMHAEAP
jgi:POT family proton-dependent oligopeptide transporter